MNWYVFGCSFQSEITLCSALHQKHDVNFEGATYDVLCICDLSLLTGS